MKRDMVVVGGSTGAVEALKPLLARLPADFGGSVLVVTHVPAGSLRLLADVLSAHSALPVAYAQDGEAPAPGRVYLAAPDRHLLLVDGRMRHGLGPRENMTRPSVDPLFRSAALAHGPRVVGVVLSGLLSDGASGLEAIKRAGGTALVQDPDTAVAPDMPLAARRATAPDHVAAPERLGELVAALAREDAPPAGPTSPELQLEVEIALGRRLGSARLRDIATPSALICPDCQGVLSEVREGAPLRFRCQTGHAYNADLLLQRDERLEDALRVALRVVEERVELVSRMEDDARRTGRPAVASLYQERRVEYADYAETLRRAAIELMAPLADPSND